MADRQRADTQERLRAFMRRFEGPIGWISVGMDREPAERSASDRRPAKPRRSRSSRTSRRRR